MYGITMHPMIVFVFVVIKVIVVVTVVAATPIASVCL